MIKRDYAAAAVLDFLEEDMGFSKANLGFYLKLLMEAQCFTISMADMLKLIDSLPDSDERQIEMPFPTVYVEYTDCQNHMATGDVSRIGVFLVGTPEDSSTKGRPAMYMTVHYLDGTQLCPGACAQHCYDPVIQLSDRVPGGQREFVEKMMRAFVSFAGILMASIVDGGVKQYVPSALRRKMHAARNKRKKLIEYKLLRLDLDRLGQRQEPGGGTHASPRLHLRRGHWRTYRSGVRRWIKPMWVGDKDKGVIHKDYEVVT